MKIDVLRLKKKVLFSDARGFEKLTCFVSNPLVSWEAPSRSMHLPSVCFTLYSCCTRTQLTTTNLFPLVPHRDSLSYQKPHCKINVLINYDETGTSGYKNRLFFLHLLNSSQGKPVSGTDPSFLNLRLSIPKKEERGK